MTSTIILNAELHVDKKKDVTLDYTIEYLLHIISQKNSKSEIMKIALLKNCSIIYTCMEVITVTTTLWLFAG